MKVSKSLQRPSRVTCAIDGVEFDAVDEAQAINRIIDELAAGQGGFVITPNVDILRQLRRPEHRELAQAADLVLADGMPVVWASRLLRRPLPARVAGSSLIFTLSRAAATADFAIYLLGGVEGASERAATRLSGEGVRVAGWMCPPLGFERDTHQVEAISRALADARPDIVYVGLGFPKQERVIVMLRERFPSVWFIGCGGSIAFAAGDIDRAPTGLQRIGLEWVHRLAMEPKRLARRYLIDDLPYAIGLLVRAGIGGVRRE
jgi:N-acetylglucosaminyldiphosphoundecaprenol N-acetyl-beta-D-mannosaminyltransferase